MTAQGSPMLPPGGPNLRLFTGFAPAIPGGSIVTPYGSGDPLVGESAASPGGPASLGHWTLGACLERLSGFKRSSISSGEVNRYRGLVDAWERHHGGGGPDVRQLEPDAFHQFAAAQPRWKSASQASNQFTRFKALLKVAAKRSDPYPLGVDQGWAYENPPAMARLNVQQWQAAPRAPDPLTVEQFGRLLEVAGRAEWPRHHGARHRRSAVPPGLLWRSYLITLWFTGSRRDVALRLRREENLRLPQLELHFKPDKDGLPVEIPLPDAVAWHLYELARYGQARLFPFPETARTEPHVTFNPTLRGFYRDAELDVPWSESTWHPSHFMRDCAIANWLDPELRFPAYYVQYVTGHKPDAGGARQRFSRVIRDHYTNMRPAKQAVRTVMADYPMPAGDWQRPLVLKWAKSGTRPQSAETSKQA